MQPAVEEFSCGWYIQLLFILNNQIHTTAMCGLDDEGAWEGIEIDLVGICPRTSDLRYEDIF